MCPLYVRALSQYTRKRVPRRRDGKELIQHDSHTLALCRCRVGWHLRAIQGSSGTRVDPPAPRDLPALKPDSEINNVLKRASSEHL